MPEHTRRICCSNHVVDHFAAAPGDASHRTVLTRDFLASKALWGAREPQVPACTACDRHLHASSSTKPRLKPAGFQAVSMSSAMLRATCVIRRPMRVSTLLHFVAKWGVWSVTQGPVVFNGIGMSVSPESNMVRLPQHIPPLFLLPHTLAINCFGAAALVSLEKALQECCEEKRFCR